MAASAIKPSNSSTPGGDIEDDGVAYGGGVSWQATPGLGIRADYTRMEGDEDSDAITLAAPSTSDPGKTDPRQNGDAGRRAISGPFSFSATVSAPSAAGAAFQSAR